jgi:hypothetical protein
MYETAEPMANNDSRSTSSEAEESGLGYFEVSHMQSAHFFLIQFRRNITDKQLRISNPVILRRTKSEAVVKFDWQAPDSEYFGVNNTFFLQKFSDGWKIILYEAGSEYEDDSAIHSFATGNECAKSL